MISNWCWIDIELIHQGHRKPVYWLQIKISSLLQDCVCETHQTLANSIESCICQTTRFQKRNFLKQIARVSSFNLHAEHNFSYTPANEVWEGVYRSQSVGWSVGLLVCWLVGLSSQSCDANYFHISSPIWFKFCRCIAYQVQMCVT